MKKFILLLLILQSAYVFAQQDTTLIYSNPGYNKDPLRSRLKQKIEEKEGLWVITLYDRKDVLIEKISFEDKKLEIRKGAYAFYENGNIKEEGHYNRGYKSGEWNYYYPNKQLYEKVNYLWGKLNSDYKSYWDDGNLKKEGTYNQGKKTGNWKMFYRDKKPALTEEYDENGKLIDGVYFDEQGKSVNNLYVIQPPSYPGGMKAFYQFLAKEIRYPVNAQKNSVQGTVRLSFVVTKTGKIQDISVIESPDNDLSREAVRVLQYSSNWLPAKELGEPVNMKYTVPVRFALK
ncbi:TonB family protein [Pedobacter polaris]|uniref:TonB family protein n=1 Tax=Pedobacter polaris TaxID=2571273 RepID=A0A4U1CV13_9SPHI|nr:energy transducer TonB [Pedobacter polaris]TKC12486.1 TonB family protein [Pedobacter polaris]